MTWNLAGKVNHVSFCRVFFIAQFQKKIRLGFQVSPKPYLPSLPKQKTTLNSFNVVLNIVFGNETKTSICGLASFL